MAVAALTVPRTGPGVVEATGRPPGWTEAAPEHCSVAVVADPHDFGGWVQAAPFRAHLRHLIGATDLPWRAVAQLCGAPPAAVRRLLVGRAGRPVRKIDPLLARRLYALSPETIRTNGRVPVPALPARQALGYLTARGWSLVELSGRLRVPTSTLAALGNELDCARLVEAQLLAAAEALGCPDAGGADESDRHEHLDGLGGLDAVPEPEALESAA